MAGRRHHFLPVFLLSGFASPKSSTKAVYTHCFRRIDGSVTADEPNVLKIAVERDFYGLEGDYTVDLAQTVKESREFAPLVRRLRGERRVPAGSENTVVDLVVNLTVRTQHIREAFLATTRALVNRLRSRTRDPEFLCRLVNDLLLQRVLQPLADRYGAGNFEAVPADIREFVCKEFLNPLREASGTWGPAVPYLQSVTESIWDEIEGAITQEAVKKAHVTSLRAAPSPPQRVASLSGLTWHVLSFDAGSVILGDVGPIARIAGSQRYESLLEVDANRDLIVALPLSGGCVLVGVRGAHPTSVDASELNESTAELSLNFFVASRRTPAEWGLSRRIGTRLDSAWLRMILGAENRFFQLASSVLRP